jgi:quinol monooxygenase YgiN
MAFVQIIEFRTNDIEGLRAAEAEWERATEGKRTARRQILARDRDDPGRHLAIVFFDSYESAMQNSEMPETKAVAEKMMALSEGEPTFHNLEVIEDRS